MFLIVVNVHHNWVEKIELEAISVMTFFPKSPKTKLLWLSNWEFGIAIELDACSPHDHKGTTIGC